MSKLLCCLLGLFIMGYGQALELAASQQPLRTVEHVQLERYLGKWYEIASFPQSFQKGCTATTAEYSLKKNGDLRVLNSCRLGSPQGQLKVAKGTAKVVDKQSNAKLKVSFFWPFYGAYWIIDLGDNYEYAVVGHPGRDYLWILSRTSVMSIDVYQQILVRLQEQHYDLKRLVRTQH